MKKFTNADQRIPIVAQHRQDLLVQYLSKMGVYGPAFARIIENLSETDYFYAPSSTKWHAAYPGGGFDHAFNVTIMLVQLTNSMGLQWQRPMSPYIIGLLHDITKVGAYLMKQEMGKSFGIKTWYEHNPDHIRLSEIHGEDSLLKVRELIPLTEEEEACIRWHMGAYEGKDSWTGYDEVIRKFPNVLWTHTADMYASKVMEGRNEE